MIYYILDDCYFSNTLGCVPDGATEITESDFDARLKDAAMNRKETMKQADMPEPSQTDRIEAQLMYTAMMTDTLLEE